MELSIEEHGKLRAGLITGSVAHIIDTGGERAWKTLAKNLWADDGTAFAKQATGARAYGHEHEREGIAKFWEHHPEKEIKHEPWFDYKGEIPELLWTTGTSPDGIIYEHGCSVAGLEVKSPTGEDKFEDHTVEKHYAQCGHGMLMTRLPAWWLVVHYGNRYFERRLARDVAWEQEYVRKLKAFLAYHQQGRSVRRKLRISDL